MNKSRHSGEYVNECTTALKIYYNAIKYTGLIVDKLIQNIKVIIIWHT